ncbi:unnamed protein product, partial [marine sediment metagenome]
LEKQIKEEITEFKRVRTFEKVVQAVEKEKNYNLNMDVWDDNNLGQSNIGEDGAPVKTIEQRIQDLNQMVVDDKITESQRNKRKALLTSTKALNAKDDDETLDGIVDQFYSLITITDAKTYQIGYKEIKDRLIDSFTQGKIEEETYRTLNNQFTQLTASSNAKSLKSLANENRKVREKIELMIPVSFRAKVTQDIFFEVIPQIMDLQKETELPITRLRSQITTLYENAADRIIDDARKNADIQSAMIINGMTKKFSPEDVDKKT